MNPEQKQTAEVWAIVELMGHVKLAGKLTEEEKFGVKMGRLDIADGDAFVTQLFGGASVYRITIVTEEVARQVNRSTSPAPVSPWDFPKQLAHAEKVYHNVCPDCGMDDDDCDCSHEEANEPNGPPF